jgi:hypothetical protein
MDNRIAEILKKYGEDIKTNTWLAPGGKSLCIKHDCVERMAAKAGIEFLPPEIVSADPNNVVIIVRAAQGPGSLIIWSFGEASPKNNKNQYPYAMAEKRGKDRVALKLLGLHGLVYSEEEADDFKPRNGTAAPPPETPNLYVELEDALANAETLDKLKAITTDRAADFARLNDTQRADLLAVYRVKAKSLKVFGEAA